MTGKALELTRKPNKNKNNTLDSLSQEIQKKPGSVKWTLVFLLLANSKIESFL